MIPFRSNYCFMIDLFLEVKINMNALINTLLIIHVMGKSFNQKYQIEHTVTV